MWENNRNGNLNMSFNNDFGGTSKAPAKGREDCRGGRSRSRYRSRSRHKSKSKTPASSGRKSRTRVVDCCGEEAFRERNRNMGKVTRNPFFNFLREFRMYHFGLHPCKAVVLGAEQWRSLQPEQKQKFKDLAKSAPKMRRRRRRKRTDEEEYY